MFVSNKAYNSLFQSELLIPVLINGLLAPRFHNIHNNTPRIHKEPGHEEDANAQQDNGEMGKHSRVDGADIATHRLQGGRLKHTEIS